MIPKTLGACADKLFILKDQKRLLQMEIDSIAEEEKEIQEYLIKELPNNGSQGVMGKIAKVVIQRKDCPTPKDWDTIQKYILKTKDFTILQRRLGEASIKEQWEAKGKNGKPNYKAIPGIDNFEVLKVSLTKV